MEAGEHNHGGTERRKGERVTFERGIAAHMMGIDGTWRRDCVMEDVSETGAKLTVEGSVEGLHLKEFFLLLSSTGLAYRRCELAWVNGDQIGVNFLKPGDKKKKAQARRGARPRTPESGIADRPSSLRRVISDATIAATDRWISRIAVI